MTKYSVKFSAKSIKQLKKIGRPQSLVIANWIAKNLEGCENPRLHGKPLVGNHSGQWRYRVGNYRIVADIIDEQIIIFVLEVGHRKNIYE